MHKNKFSMFCFLNEPSMAYFWSFSNNNTMVTINKWEHFFINYLLLGFELTTSHIPITIGTRCLLLERVQKNCEKCNKIVLPNSNLKYFYLFVAFGRALNNKNSITNTGTLNRKVQVRPEGQHYKHHRGMVDL